MTTAPEALTSPLLASRHGFFTRRGGVSTGPFASLNCSLSGGDDPAAVGVNRGRVQASLGAEALLGVTQVHGAEVVTVTAPWGLGQGARADAMVTAVPGLALGVITADCTPVLLEDRRVGVVGAVHAGWRGALAGVLEATVAAMMALGARPADIVAAVGPSIRQESYEVGADLRDAVLADTSAAERFFRDGRLDESGTRRWQFDLAGYCVARLAEVAQVDVIAADTMADETRFFSHRRRTLARSGPIGHQISAIVL